MFQIGKTSIDCLIIGFVTFSESIDFHLSRGTCSQVLFPCSFSDAMYNHTCCSQGLSSLPGFRN